MADRRVLGALVAVQVLFGLWPIAATELFAVMPPLVLVVARTMLAALVMVALHPLLVRQPVDLRAEAATIPTMAALGVVLNQGLFVVGLSLTTPVHSAIIVTAVPVFTYALAVMAGREQLGPRRATGIGLALVGAIVLVGVSRLEGTRQAIGDLLILLNAIAFAGFLVVSKPLSERYSPFSPTTAAFVAGSIMLLPVMVIADAPAHVAAIPGRAWALLAFAVLGPTVVTYALNATALRSVPASTVAVFIYLQPVVAAAGAWAFLGQGLPWRVVPAALLVFSGVWLVARKRPAVLHGRAVVA